MLKSVLFSLVICIALAAPSAAGTISPVAATSSTVLYGALPYVYDGILNYDRFVGLSASGGWANFDLGSAYSLTGMNLWNNAGYIPNDGEGIGSFTLTFRNASLATIGTYNGNATDLLSQQAFAFGSASPSGARYVELTINSSHGKAYADFYEVNFAAVPEPSTLCLAALSLAALWSVRRRIA